MNKTLMRAVAESAAFVELSGDDIIDPDAAVAHMEQLGAVLQELSTEERKELESFLVSMSESEKKAHGNQERVDFFLMMAKNLQLTEDRNG
jgi:hypothetical protein